MTRTADFEELCDAFRATRSGASGVALISGNAGMGKSLMLQTFAAEVSDVDTTTLIATCSTAERDLEMGVVAQLAANQSLPFEYRVRTDELVREYSASGTAAPEHLSRAVLDVVLELASRGPLVIGIDDFHHIDEASMRVLLYCSLRWSSARVLLVLTETPDARTRFATLRAELLRGPYCRRIRLAPLNDIEIISMLTKHMDPDTAARMAPAIEHTSGGNPLLAKALADDLVGAGSQGNRELPVGETYAEAVLRVLRRSSTEARALAQVIAAFTEPPTLTLLTEVAGAPDGSIARLIGHLHRTGLMDGYAFRHPTAAAAVLEELPGDRLIHLQTTIAAGLHRHGAPARVVSDHLIRWAAPVEPWAVPLLCEAASHAVAEGDFAVAVDFLDLAHRSTSESRQRAVLAVLRADAEWQGRPAVGPTRFGPLADSLVGGTLDGDEALVLVQYLLWYGRFEQARTALEVLRPGPEGSGHEVLRLRAFRRWVRCTYPRVLDPRDRVEDHGSAPARSVVTALTNPLLDVAQLLDDLLTGAVHPDIVHEAEYILRNCEPAELGRYPLASVVEVLIYSGSLDMAEHWCSQLIKSEAVQNNPAASALLRSLRSETALRRGELPRAVEHAQDALQLLPPEGWGVGIGSPLATLVLAHTAMGQLQEAERALDIPIPKQMAETRFGARYCHARGHYYLATSQIHAAIRDFQVCADVLQRGNIDNPSLVPWRTDLARAYMRLGRDAEAKLLAEAQLAVVGPDPSVPRALALGVLADCMPQHQRSTLLNEAVQILEACGDQLELARALHASSEAAYTAGHSARARMTLRRAQRIADFAKIHLPAGAGEASPTTSNGADHPLTEAEHRVATLAAQGFTNREVAAKLFLSVSTVEQHLSRVYRKLNVKRRRDLSPGLLA